MESFTSFTALALHDFRLIKKKKKEMTFKDEDFSSVTIPYFLKGIPKAEFLEQ